MPFNSNLKAKSSADGNCGLNCFMPTVAAIFNEGTHIQEKDSMAVAFKNYYKIEKPFTRATLAAIVQNTQDPIEREALLAPVLRQMMVDSMRRSDPDSDQAKPTEAYITRVSAAGTPLYSSDLLYLAHDLGISLEAYDPQNNQVDTLSGRKSKLSSFVVKPYAQLHTLKIKNENAHWEFERTWSKNTEENKKLLDAHNAKYQGNLRHFNSEALRDRVKTEVEAGHTRLSRLFAEPDILLKPAVNDVLGDMGSALKNAFSGLVSPLKGALGGISAKVRGVLNQVGSVVKSMLGNAPANTFEGFLSGAASKVDGFLNGIIAGANGHGGQPENGFRGLFKMLAGLFNAIMGFFGQGTQVTAKKDAAELTAKRVDLKVDADKPQPADSEVAKKLQELNGMFAFNSFTQPAQALQPVPNGRLTQFETRKAKSLQYTEDKSSIQPKLAAVGKR